MSKKELNKIDSIYTALDDPMQGEDQETEESGFDLTATESQERVHSSNSEESITDICEEDFNSRQRQLDREGRTRLNSPSPVKSQSPPGRSVAFSNLRELDKQSRYRKPNQTKDSTTHKRERSSHSSVDDSMNKLPKINKTVFTKSTDLVTAAGGTDRKNQTPLVKRTPPPSTKPNKPKLPEPTPTRSTGISGHKMANRHTSDQHNTDEFEVVEQNSERVNINDISRTPEIAMAILKLSKDDGLKSLQSFVSAGKRFSEAIVKSRSSGKKFIRAIGLIVNIQTDPDQITHMDLTKQRMMALCHKILYQSGKCKGYNSPLVGRINFDDANPLTHIRPLLGAGFQFLGRVVIESYSEENYKTGLLLFHLGCITLDYIRKTSVQTDSRTGAQHDPQIDPNEVDLVSYACSDDAGEGEVFIAGCRNLDQSALSVLEENAATFYGMVRQVRVGKYGGSLGHRVAQNFSSVASEMKRLMDVDDYSN